MRSNYSMLFFYQFTKSLISNRSLLCLSMLHLSKRDSSMGVILAWSMVSLYAKMSPCSTPSYNLKDALLLNSLFFSVFVRDPLRSLYSRPSPMTISSVHNIIPWEKNPSQLSFLLFRFEKEAFSIHLCDLSVDDETIFYGLQSSFQLTICFHNTWYTSKFTMLHIFIFIFTLSLPNFQFLWNLKMLLYS